MIENENYVEKNEWERYVNSWGKEANQRQKDALGLKRDENGNQQ